MKSNPLTQGFARVVDVLLSEYKGWDVDKVLDMSIARIRLLLATIEERNMAQFKANAKLHEWSAKTIAQVVAATTGKEGKELQKAVAKISLSFADEENLEQVDADTLYEASPGAESGEHPSLAENKPGSYEALLKGFR